MAKFLQLRTGDIKGGIVIAYSDYRFFRDVLQGKAYQYWWDIMIRTPEYRVLSTVEMFRTGELRR